MKKEPIGVKGPMKKSEVYSSGSNLFAHKPVLTRKDSRPIKGGGEMDSPEGATIILGERGGSYAKNMIWVVKMEKYKLGQK